MENTEQGSEGIETIRYISKRQAGETLKAGCENEGEFGRIHLARHSM